MLVTQETRAGDLPSQFGPAQALYMITTTSYSYLSKKDP